MGERGHGGVGASDVADEGVEKGWGQRRGRGRERFRFLGSTGAPIWFYVSPTNRRWSGSDFGKEMRVSGRQHSLPALQMQVMLCCLCAALR
eukprot:3025008-Rhodomonas_salina.1